VPPRASLFAPLCAEAGNVQARALRDRRGSRPIGYRIVAAEQRGSKTKKKLEIDPLHADTVRLIYRLFLEGDGATGPMGVKAITCHLNERRIFTRDGGRRRHHGVAPARVTSGPTLLTGICFCAKCGGAMTLRTGKGGVSGVYRYDTCSIKARQGKTGCKGRSIPMDRLDQLIASHLEERLLQPERLETILASVLDRRQERAQSALDNAGNQAVSPDMSRPSPGRPANASGWKAAVAAATTCAPWPSASRSRTGKSVSWDRSRNVCAPWSPLQSGNQSHLEFRVLF